MAAQKETRHAIPIDDPHRREKMGTSAMLRALIIANLIASTLHFGDNMLRFSEYPEPHWISNPPVCDSLWLAITPLLGVGWWLARRAMKWAAIAGLWVYGVLSLFALGHYFYAAPSQLSLRINLLIGAEAAAAALLIVSAPFLVPRQAAGCA